jgi:hypothetical protein
LICAALALSAQAQDQAAVNDAVSWVSGVRDPLRRMTNQVVTAYGIASLAALVCPVDKGVGSGLFHEALADLNGIPENIFQDSTKLLPVATFSGLWKLVVGPGIKCDPALPQPSDHARERRDAERRQAAAFLAQAKFTDDYDRAAQLAAAAMEAADPYQLDVSSITAFLIELRVPAPDLSDEVFQRAIAYATSADIPNMRPLADLGNYLFVGSAYIDRSEPLLNRTSYAVNGSAFWDWTGQHENTNPDMVAAYIGAVAALLSRPEAASLDPVSAYATAYQLLPKARDLALSDADTLQKYLDQAQVQNATVASAVQAKLGGSLQNGGGQSNFARLMAQIRGAIAAGRFAQARELLLRVDGVPLRSQVAALIDFHEAAAAVSAKDSDRALELAGGLAGGVKRTLLYAGIVGTASKSLTAISALHLGLKDAELLSYEQRMAVLPALAAACMPVDRDETQAVLSQLITSYNDATTSPRKTRFDPKNDGPFDGQRVIFGRAGFVEVVQGGQHQQSFPLRVTGVSAFSLEDFLTQAKDMDFPRLVATVEQLRDEIHLVKAYLALARLRLKTAKSATRE